MLNVGITLEEFSSTDAFQNPDAVGNRDWWSKRDKDMNMIGWYFEFVDSEIVVVACFQNDFFQGCSVSLFIVLVFHPSPPYQPHHEEWRGDEEGGVCADADADCHQQREVARRLGA